MSIPTPNAPKGPALFPLLSRGQACCPRRPSGGTLLLPPLKPIASLPWLSLVARHSRPSCLPNRHEGGPPPSVRGPTVPPPLKALHQGLTSIAVRRPRGSRARGGLGGACPPSRSQSRSTGRIRSASNFLGCLGFKLDLPLSKAGPWAFVGDLRHERTAKGGVRYSTRLYCGPQTGGTGTLRRVPRVAFHWNPGTLCGVTGPFTSGGRKWRAGASGNSVLGRL